MNFYPKRRRKPEIIIISLIDIFAILLIFTIVTTTFKTAETPSVTIKLPESKTAVVAEKGQEALRLSISENEEIFLGAKKVALADLKLELETLQKLPNPPKLALATDKKAPFGVVIAVLDALKQAGVKGDLTAFTEGLK